MTTLDASILRPMLREPRIFSHFYVPKSEKTEYSNRFNSKNKDERKLWRHVLNHNANQDLEDFITEALNHNDCLFVFVDGSKGVGKSIFSVTLMLLIIEYQMWLKKISDTVKMWSRNYGQTNEKISQATCNGDLAIILQDEDESLIGDDKITEKGKFTNNLKTGRITGHHVILDDQEFDPSLVRLMNFRITIIGYNTETMYSLGILYNKFNTPLGWITLKLRYTVKDGEVVLDPTYTIYKKWKAGSQKTLSAEGGGRSGANTEKYNRLEQRVWDIYVRDYQNKGVPFSANKFKVILQRYGIVVSTGDPRDALYERLLERYEQHELESNDKPSNCVKAEKQLNREPPKKSEASEYSNRGHEEEAKLWTKYLPKLFMGTKAKIIYGGAQGQADGIIECNRTTYVCNSKDYSIPLNQRSVWVHYNKLKAEFDRYNEERQRSPEKQTILCLMLHEVNRNSWQVNHIPNPETVPRGTKGRPTGSLRVNL